MGNNDWGTPAPGGNPWRQEPGAGNTGNTGKSGRAGGLATGIIVAAVVAVVAVVVVVGLAVSGMLAWNNTTDDASDDGGSPLQFTAVPEPEVTSETSETPTSVRSPEPSTSSAPTTSSTPTTTSSPGTPSDLSPRGWRGVSAASCNSSDEWVYAGTNGEDYAVVCRVGERGDLYYRGFYNDRSAEYDIDMGRVSAGRWVTRSLDGNGSRVELTGSGVRVIDGSGDEVSSRDFTWSSEDAG